MPLITMPSANNLPESDYTDYKEIIEVWRAVFTNDSTYLSLVLKDLLPFCKNYVIRQSGEVVSAAAAIPLDLKWPDKGKTKTVSGYYLYGVATLEKARGKGLSRSIVKRIIEESRKEGKKFIITRPAEPSLFNFYKSQGFSLELFKERAYTKEIPPVERVRYPLTGKILKKLREEYFIRKLGVPLYCFEEKVLTHIINTTLYDGGDAFYINFKREKLFCITTINQALSTIEIAESSIPIKTQTKKELFALILPVTQASEEFPPLARGIFDFPME